MLPAFLDRDRQRVRAQLSQESHGIGLLLVAFPHRLFADTIFGPHIFPRLRGNVHHVLVEGGRNVAAVDHRVGQAHVLRENARPRGQEVAQ